jgi:hypothetical protein
MVHGKRCRRHGGSRKPPNKRSKDRETRERVLTVELAVSNVFLLAIYFAQIVNLLSREDQTYRNSLNQAWTAPRDVL